MADGGRLDEAIAEYQKVLITKPDLADTRRSLDTVLSQREGILKGLAAERESLLGRPDDVALLNDLAWALATNPNVSVRNGEEAVELARRAVKLSGGRNPAILGTLAAAYAEAGRFPEAVETGRKALELATRQKQQALLESIRAKLLLYEAKVPYREPSQPPSHPSQ